MKKRRTIVLVDPQNDFMDLSGANLAVPGAVADMDRVAQLIANKGDMFDNIVVTMDTHRVVDIAHPAFWCDVNGNPPAPFTLISAEDIRQGKFRPRNADAKPAVLEGKSLKEYAVGYAEALERSGQKALIIWPEHCIIGSWGHNIYGPLLEELNGWERRNFATVNYAAKGVNVFTEHYGAFRAEVPFPGDPATELNVALLQELQKSDELVIAGEASSHCVMETVNQIADFVGDAGIKKLVLLEDCMSPVPQVGDGPDFPKMAQDWIGALAAKGANVVKVADYMANL